MNKTNYDYPLIQNSEIIEWDIKQANVSLLSYYQILPEEKIKPLRGLDKKERQVRVGYLLKDRDLSKRLEKGFNDIISEFLEANHLAWEDIVSVKKDAIFVKNHAINQTTFGDTVEFIPKNVYQHAILIPNYEFYVGRSQIDVKGIDDEMLPFHKNGMLHFIKTFLYYRIQYKRWLEFCRDYAQAYKAKDLEYDAYRQFNSASRFIINRGGYQIEQENITEDDLPNLDILYNYVKIILPTINLAFNN